MAATAPPAPPRTRELVAHAARSVFEGTPGRLRLYGLVAAVSCLLFGVFAFVAASSRAASLSDARADAAQLVRIQTIRTNLVFAAANLTNAFLVGGLEPPAARSAYEQGIATASRTLTEAAAMSSADAGTLGEINDGISRYAGLVESARANNRLGYPIGAAYLRQANQLLVHDVLQPLEALGRSEQERVDNSYAASARAMTWLVIGAGIALVVLIVVQYWLSARTRRTFNLPLLGATAGVVLLGAVLAGTMVWSQSRAQHARDHAYFGTVELATARIDAFNAKSAESLTLIARGSGQAYESNYQYLAANAKKILDDAAARGGPDERAAAQAFAAYQTLHTTIRQADDGGNWDRAVALATGNKPGDANAVFRIFDTASAKALDERSGQLRDDLGTARGPLTPVAWIALIVGVLAGGLSVRGFVLRLREYR